MKNRKTIDVRCNGKVRGTQASEGMSCGEAENGKASNLAFQVVDPLFRKEIERIAVALKPYLGEDECEIVDRCVDLYGRNEFVIMVAGEISVGKSSLLNALMGQSILLTDMTETTAAITYLRSAEGRTDVKPDHVRINYKSGKSEWFSIHDNAKLRQVTTSLNGNTKAIDTVKSAEVFCSQETLPIPPGFTIIDTPGLNGSESHADLTHREMGLCHAALYLLDATKFGTLSNKEEFQRLYRYAPEVLFVVNKWDLVRSAGLDLTTMKRETYFPQLGNWTTDGEVTDENIFVISGAEAFEAKEKFLAESQRQARLQHAQRRQLTDTEFLPFKDNEYFALEARLQHILMAGEKTRMLRRRPLQTLMQLAIDAAKMYEERKRTYLSERKELDRRIESEVARIRRERDDAAEAFDEIRKFANRLADVENAAYRQSVNEGASMVADGIRKFIATIDSGELLKRGGQQRISSQLQKLVERHFRCPVSKRFESFMGFLGKQLEMDVDVKTSDGVSVAKTTEVANDIAILKRQQDELAGKIAAIGPKRESLNAKKSRCEGEILKLKHELNALENQEAQYRRLEAQRDDLRLQQKRLGARPAPKKNGYYVTKTVPRRRKKGLFGRIWAWFTDGDDYEIVQEEVTVWKETVDDSAGRRWEVKFNKLDQEIKSVEGMMRSTQPNGRRMVSLKDTIQRHEAEIKRCEAELRKLDTAEKEQEAAFRRQGEDALRRKTEKYWLDEVSRIRDSFFATVSGFRNEVTRFLDEFWVARNKRIEHCIVEMGNRERELDNRRRQASSEFAEIERGQIELARIIGLLEKRLKEEFNS